MKALRIALFLILITGLPAMSQVTKIMGHVTDARTKDPIPFVNILIRGTTLGVLTDFDGNYAIEFKTPADSIRATLIGYKPVTKNSSATSSRTSPSNWNPNSTTSPRSRSIIPATPPK